MSEVDETFQWALQPMSHDQKDQLKVAIEKGDRTVTCEGVLGLTSLGTVILYWFSGSLNAGHQTLSPSFLATPYSPSLAVNAGTQWTWPGPLITVPRRCQSVLVFRLIKRRPPDLISLIYRNSLLHTPRSERWNAVDLAWSPHHCTAALSVYTIIYSSIPPQPIQEMRNFRNHVIAVELVPRSR